MSGNQWTSAFKAILGTLAALLDDDMSLGSVDPSTLHPVVYSRTRHMRGLSPYTFKVTSATVNASEHFLRSRMTSP